MQEAWKMSTIFIYAGIGFLALGVILLIVDATTYKKRREKKIEEIERDFS